MSAAVACMATADMWRLVARLRVTTALVSNERPRGETAALDDAMDRYARGDDAAVARRQR